MASMLASRLLRRVLLPSLLIVCAQFHAGAQHPVAPAVAFRAARALYYTPVDKGLQGFQCNVGFDWKQFMEKANNATISDRDPRLLYLQSVKLTVTDDLNGAGSLTWDAPNAAPDGSDSSVAKIRSGLQSIWSGFFQSWNGFYTGAMVSVTDNNTTVERTADGFHLSAKQGGGLAEELFSKDLTLLSIHVVTPQMETTMTPLFQQTPQGRQVTALNSTVKQPPSAPAIKVDMTVHYAPVNGFQLPSELLIDIAGQASFDFHLNGCTVNAKQ